MGAFPEKTSRQLRELREEEDLLPLWVEPSDMLGAQMVWERRKGRFVFSFVSHLS